MVEHVFNEKTFSEIQEFVHSNNLDCYYGYTKSIMSENNGNLAGFSESMYCRINDKTNKKSFLFAVHDGIFSCVDEEELMADDKYLKMDKI